MAKFDIIDPNYSKIGIESIGVPDTVKVTGETILTLAWLFAYDDNANEWKPPKIDSNGRLLVSLSASQTENVTQSVVSTSTSNTLVANSNSDRKQIIIQNVGNEDVYLGLSSGNATTNDMLLKAGATLIEDIYIGEINVIMASGTSELRVAEYT